MVLLLDLIFTAIKANLIDIMNEENIRKSVYNLNHSHSHRPVGVNVN